MQTKKLSLHHVIRPGIISADKKSSALLMLHGYGSNEMDLFSFAGELPENLFIISARAPRRLPFGGFSWYDIHFDADDNKFFDDLQAMESLRLISSFIDELFEAYDLDVENFNLLGFSQGSIMSYALGFTFPEKLKNIVALSGYINEDIMPFNQKNEQYKDLDFFISHGIYDPVLPVEWARRSPQYLSERKIEHIYKEYPMGHEVNRENFEDFRQWLSERI